MTMKISLRPRIKICGITRLDDALDAAYLGADALGLVFYAPSPRAVSVAQARAISAVLPPFITLVGLFVDAPAAEVEAICAQVPLDLLQFHGEESPAYCAAFHRPYIKAVRMKPGLDLAATAARYDSARALLLDTYVAGTPGGTGTVFDWTQVPSALSKPLIVAGGLDAANVGDAIAALQPWAVDVSGGVETAKGIKNHAKMAAFIAAARPAKAIEK
jgi:phosphoribosylanthranilate isomerase